LQHLPEELSSYRHPRKKSDAEAGAVALIAYLKKKQSEGGARYAKAEDITVGAWIEKFTAIETSPRTGFNASRNRPYSPDTVETYRGYYNTHIRGDPFILLKMAEVEEEDAMEYITRLSVKRLIATKGKAGRPMGGSRTFAGVIGFAIVYFVQDHRAISDVSEAKREKDRANGPVLHFERRFFRGRIPEIHP
jgi:hypothetical protein